MAVCAPLLLPRWVEPLRALRALGLAQAASRLAARAGVEETTLQMTSAPIATGVARRRRLQQQPTGRRHTVVVIGRGQVIGKGQVAAVAVVVVVVVVGTLVEVVVVAATLGRQCRTRQQMTTTVGRSPNADDGLCPPGSSAAALVAVAVATPRPIGWLCCW